MSFYFKASIDNVDEIPTGNHNVPLVEEGEAFRWIDIGSITKDDFTFPIDKMVAEKLARYKD